MIRTPKKVPVQQVNSEKSNCNVCSLETKDQKTIICDICSKYYHISCIGMKLKSFQDLIKRENSIWLCSICQKDLVLPVGDKCETETSSKNVSKAEILEMFKQANEELMEKVMSNVKNLQLQIANVAETTSEGIKSVSKEMHQKFESIDLEILDLKNEKAGDLQHSVDEIFPLIQDKLIEKLDVPITTLNNLSALETAVDRMERQNHSSNLVLDGIPFTLNENVYHLFYDIADKLKVQVNEHDVNVVFRIKSQRKNSSIIVCFQSKYVRDRIYASYMNNTVKLSDIGFRGMTGRLYMNEHLTQKYADIFRKTRELKRQNLIHKSYTLNGIPYVVHKADEKSVKVLSANDLTKFESKVETDSKEVDNGESSEQQVCSGSGKRGG